VAGCRARAPRARGRSARWSGRAGSAARAPATPGLAVPIGLGAPSPRSATGRGRRVRRRRDGSRRDRVGTSGRSAVTMPPAGPAAPVGATARCPLPAHGTGPTLRRCPGGRPGELRTRRPEVAGARGPGGRTRVEPARLGRGGAHHAAERDERRGQEAQPSENQAAQPQEKDAGQETPGHAKPPRPAPGGVDEDRGKGRRRRRAAEIGHAQVCSGRLPRFAEHHP
jgi:hypothetical protein